MTLTVPGASPPPQAPSPGWGQSLGTSAAGIMLVHIEHALAGTAGWDTVHEWARAVIREQITAHPASCGLYYGAPAVAFALRATGQPAYTGTVRTLDEHIATLVRQRLAQAHDRIHHGQLPALREFDLVRGLTGIGAYLLHRDEEMGVLRDVLAYLVCLTEPVTVAGETVPGWWTANGPGDQPSEDWPGGHGNLGIAHGIAGPLAVLALALARAITVPGHADAIERICSFIDQWRSEDPSGDWWPGLISRAEYRARAVNQPGPQRPSWCYGTPGLARAQQLAAIALGDRRRQCRAETALAGCIADEAQLSQLVDASLCHGWAGLLHTAGRAAADAGIDSDLARLLSDLRARADRHGRHHEPVTDDGLLEGCAGIALAHRTTPPVSRWDACLLLAPPTIGER